MCVRGGWSTKDFYFFHHIIFLLHLSNLTKKYIHLPLHIEDHYVYLSSPLGISEPLVHEVGIFSETGIVIIANFGKDQIRIFTLYSQAKNPKIIKAITEADSFFNHLLFLNFYIKLSSKSCYSVFIAL